MSVKNVWRVWFALILITVSMTNSTPVHALGTPQFVRIDPPQSSPQIIGVCVYVTVKVDWDNDFRDMRVRFGHEGWQHSSETQFSRIFCTKDYEPGIYKLRVEVAGKDDNNWDHPKVTEVDYELKNLEDFYPPNTVAIFGSRGTFDAKVGPDLYHIQDGVIVNYEDVRWLVPNSQTAEALCIFWNTTGNLWDWSDNDILSIPRGPDIPDVTKDPQQFWSFRNKYFPYCGYVPSQPTATLQEVPQAEQNTENVGPAIPDEPQGQEQTNKSGWCNFWLTAWTCVSEAKASTNTACQPQCVIEARKYRDDLYNEKYWTTAGRADSILEDAQKSPIFIYKGVESKVRVRDSKEQPQAGDLVIWPWGQGGVWAPKDNQGNKLPGGHIGYVTASRPGYITVHDANWNNDCKTRDVEIKIESYMKFITSPYPITPIILVPDRCDQYQGWQNFACQYIHWWTP